MPNSPTLMNAGRELGQLSACFVLPVEDDIESIFDAVKQTALIHKSGGGTGFSFSRIRPANDPVMSTKGVASGPISFMNIFDVATETIKQGGTRRGANMGILRVDHPDIVKFITCKMDTKRLTNFNISVGLTDAFMEAVAEDRLFPLVNPRSGKEVQKVKAAALFDLIVQSAWSTGEPGIIFLDRSTGTTPSPTWATSRPPTPAASSPCCPTSPATWAPSTWPRWSKTAPSTTPPWRTWCTPPSISWTTSSTSTNSPWSKIEKRTLETRKIGLGVMGFADLLLKLGVQYNSDEAVAVAETGHGLHQGRVAPGLRPPGRHPRQLPGLRRQQVRGQRPGPHAQRHHHHHRPHRHHQHHLRLLLRHRAPLRGLLRPPGHGRHRNGGGPPLLRGHRQEPGLLLPGTHEAHRPDRLHPGDPGDPQGRPPPLRHRPRNHPHLAHQDPGGLPEIHRQRRLQDGELPPAGHRRRRAPGLSLGLRAGPQGRHHLPRRLPGRTGPELRRRQAAQPATLTYITPRPRPARTTGVTEAITTGCGKLYVTVNRDHLGFCEVFAQMGKTGGCASSQIESTGRLISLALRSGVTIESVIKKITGIRCPSPNWQNGCQVLSCPDAIAKVLANVAQIDQPESPQATMGSCPDCGGAIEPEGGCLVCRSCGFTRCS